MILGSIQTLKHQSFMLAVIPTADTARPTACKCVFTRLVKQENLSVVWRMQTALLSS